MATQTTTASRAQSFAGAGALAKEIAVAGSLAGLLGGLLLMAWQVLQSVAFGQGFWLPFKLISGMLLGIDALLAGPGAILTGLVVHLGVSVALGVGFALLLRRDTVPSSALLWGLTYGVAIWAIMTYLVLWGDPTMRDRVLLTPRSWFWAHLIFGVGISTAPALRRSLFAEPQIPAKGLSR